MRGRSRLALVGLLWMSLGLPGGVSLAGIRGVLSGGGGAEMVALGAFEHLKRVLEGVDLKALNLHSDPDATVVKSLRQFIDARRPELEFLEVASSPQMPTESGVPMVIRLPGAALYQKTDSGDMVLVEDLIERVTRVFLRGALAEGALPIPLSQSQLEQMVNELASLIRETHFFDLEAPDEHTSGWRLLQKMHGAGATELWLLRSTTGEVRILNAELIKSFDCSTGDLEILLVEGLQAFGSRVVSQVHYRCGDARWRADMAVEVGGEPSLLVFRKRPEDCRTLLNQSSSADGPLRSE